jgi:hypothetical protein
MSLSYANFPIYVGSASASSIPYPNEQTTFLPSTNVAVSYSTSTIPNRKLGKAVAQDDQFKFGGPLSATVSFQMLLCNDVPYLETGYSFLSGQSGDFFPVQIGSGIFNKCYLQDYTVSIQPYTPVTVDVNFVSLDPPTGQQVSGDPDPYKNPFGVLPAFDGDEFVYGHTCAVQNMTDVVGNVQSSITYRKNFARTPTYTLGSVNATDMLLDGIETETTITSTGLENLINFSGDETTNDLTIALDNAAGNSIRFFTGIVVGAGARVLQESYSMAGGDTLQTTATLREILL